MGSPLQPAEGTCTFTGASACWEPVKDKVKHYLSCTDLPSSTILFFLSIHGFLMYLLYLHVMAPECFFSFLNGNRGPHEDLHCGVYLHDNFWFTSLLFVPQTLIHREMLLMVHVILSPTQQC